MEAEQVAKRYAQGLFEVASEKSTSDNVNQDFKDIAEICRADRSLIEFLAAPQVLDEDKEKVIGQVFKGKVAEELFSLMQLLVRKRRTNFLVEIAEAFDRLVLDSQGVIKTKLVSAVPLTEEIVTQIETALARLTGKTIQLETRVDSSIIGGLIAFVGDKIIDRSVRHDLVLLKERLMELKVH